MERGRSGCYLLQAAAVLVVGLLLIVLAGCDGYNAIMYEHLSNAENYEYFRGKIEDVLVYYTNGVSHSIFASEHFREADEIGIKLLVYREAEDAYDDQSVRFELNGDNVAAVYDSGFFEVAVQGMEIELLSSRWIYMDTEFNYIIELRAGGKEYLSEERGLANVIAMMDDDRSLL